MGVLKGCGDLWAFWCNGRTDKVICRGPLAHKKRMVNSYCQHYCSAPVDRSMEVKLGQTDLPADQPTDGQIGSWESLYLSIIFVKASVGLDMMSTPVAYPLPYGEYLGTFQQHMHRKCGTDARTDAKKVVNYSQ